MSEDKTPRRGRGVKIALALSLALNLAVVGMVAGAVLGGGGARDRGALPGDLRSLGLGPFAQALSQQDRTELRDRIEARGTALREERRAVGQGLRAVEAALRAEPFERTAVEAALERSRALVVALQAAGHGALLDQIETMSVAERRELADGLARAMDRIRRR